VRWPCSQVGFLCICFEAKPTHFQYNICDYCTDLHTRWARRPFASPSLWEVPRASSCPELRADLRRVLLLGISNAPGSVAGFTPSLHRARAVLRLLPWAIPFYDRVKLFRDVVATERLSIQGSDDVNAGNRSRVSPLEHTK
jgi:hypothetical protein